MEIVNRLVENYNNAFDGKNWYGPSLMEILNGVDAGLASKKIIQDAHTIWQIVLHIIGWEKVVCQRLRGENLREPEEGNFPAITENNENNWANTIRLLKEVHIELAKEMQKVNNNEL